MKILQVIPYFNPKMGGDVDVCYNISKQLVKNGHNVTILTTNYNIDNTYSKPLEKFGVNIVPINCIANIASFLYSPSMKKWLKTNLKSFDVIHLHTFRAYQNNIIRKYSVKFGVPYIVQAHGSVLPFFSKIGLKKIYDKFEGNAILKNSATCIAITETEAKDYIKMGVNENKIKIVPNGIDLEEYASLPKPGIFRNKYDISKKEKIVLYLGRIHESKGLEMLVDAFSIAAKEIESLKFVLIGPDAGYRNQLENQIETLGLKNKVLFTGFVSKEEKLSALVDADVFVTPRFSGFPITFLEACACGTPIITTNNGDRLDWIHNKVGYVVKYDANALADATSRLLKNSNLGKEFGGNGFQLTYTKFNWGHILHVLEKIYAQKEENL